MTLKTMPRYTSPVLRGVCMRITIQRTAATGRRAQWQFLGHPLAVFSILVALFVLLAFTSSVLKQVHNSYFPYEGYVVDIRTRWLDGFLFESGDYEHLVIETPDGETIDRITSLFVRSQQHIKTGDYVKKKRGFRNRVTAQPAKAAQPDR